MSLPLDNDGFLSRQCPHCSSRFKWHHGPANEDAEQAEPPPAYHCPLCGLPAETDRWFTDEQVDYLNGVAMPQIAREIDDMLGDAFKGLNSSFIKVTKTGNLDVPAEPDPLVDLDDEGMVIVTPPCHAYEPIKVAQTVTAPLHCLVCGEPFAL